MQADRSTALKFVKSHRKQPPGQHGKKKSFGKITGYGLQLREKQKARIFYHLTEKQLRKYYAEAAKVHGSTDTALLAGLERRLDNVVYRAGLTNSHPQARQIVNHALFSLNGRKVSIPSMIVKPGDVITFRGSKALKEKLVEISKNEKPVSWLKVNSDELSIEVVNLPSREEIEVPFNEKLIIEFYSR